MSLVETIIALTAIVGGLLFLASASYMGVRAQRRDRELTNIERMAAIDKGREYPLPPLQPPPAGRKASPFRDGIGFLVVGLGLTFALWRMSLHAWPWGVVVVSIGLANLAYWFLGGRAEWERQQALDEELQRAYTRRLEVEGNAPHPRDEA